MKQRKLRTLLASTGLVLLVLGVFSFSAAGAATPAPESKQPKRRPVALKALTAWAKDTVMNDGFRIILDKIEQKAKGKLVVKWVGGPEAIAAFDQMEAARKGVVDMSNLVASYAAGVLPEAAAVFALSTMRPWEERKIGFYDFMVKRFETINLRLLGRTTGRSPFYIYTNVRVKKLGDLARLKIRTSGGGVALIKAIGASPVVMPMGEIWSALDRGVVDGFFTTQAAFAGKGYEEVVKYFIDHPLFTSSAILVMNLDRWNRLPEDLQKSLLDAMVAGEHEIADHYDALAVKLTKEAKKAGLEGIKLPTEDAKRYIEAVYNARWRDVEKKSPGPYLKLREFLVK